MTFKLELQCHELFFFLPLLDGLHLKFSKANGLWTAKETCVYIGKPMGVQGKQRRAIWVTFLHQEERLSRCGATHSEQSLDIRAFPLLCWFV